MRKLTQEEFLNKVIFVHKDKYDYSKIIYNGVKEKIKVICSIHGDFEILPRNFINLKRGCPQCGNILGRLKSTKKIDVFIEEANIIHQNNFNYSKSIYINNNTKLIIICKIHGEFLQSPDKHLLGQGCPKCKNDKISKKQRDNLENFIKKANIIHFNKYNYDESVYGKNAHEKIKIICFEHGEFWQIPTGHLSGKGCPSCAHIISKPEQQWLDYIKIPLEFRNIYLNIDRKVIKVDAFDPTTNTIYEFYGDFWHGNPNVYDQNDLNKVSKKKFGELYFSTLKREKFLMKNGYRIISIWENDWNKLNV